MREPTPKYFVAARFGPDAARYSECPAQRTIGACSVGQCSFAISASAPTAGEIVISGGSTEIAMSPDAGGSYALSDVPGTLFTGGESLTFVASGGEVPGFSGTIVAPTPLELAEPQLPDSPTTAVTLVRGAPLTVAWTGTSSGVMRVQLARQPRDVATTVTCRFDVAAGTGTVPADLIAQLPTGTGAIVFSQLSASDVTAGEWTVSIEAENIARSGTREAVSNIEIQ
jgi:hypothetical protein